ncbi:MAG: hypothetical protein R6W74_10740, partial [Nitrosomonas halophila]
RAGAHCIFADLHVRELTILTAVIHLYATITHALAGNSKCIGNLAFLHKNPVKHFLHFFR